jgi:2Fe-2S ferredoxin
VGLNDAPQERQMAEIIFLAHEGTEYRVAARAGQSVMQAALFSGVPGIVAECGGCAACATCRVFVDESWANRLQPPAALESSMLEEDGGRPHLRLSCQIAVDETLDGLIVHMPESQY